MATDVRADPVELTRLAADVLTASQKLADIWRSAKNPLAMPVAAFGNSNGATGVHDANQAVVDDADVTIGRQVAVLEGDVDRLYRVAFAYEKAELDAQEAMRRAASGVGGTP